MSTVDTSAMKISTCPYCGLLPHATLFQCPMVAAIEYWETGMIKRVEKIKTSGEREMETKGDSAGACVATQTHAAKSKWQLEFDALPYWAQQFVLSLQGCVGHGGFNPDLVGITTKNAVGRHVVLAADKGGAWYDGLGHALDLAKALTAPWPPPPAPTRERRAFNLVEMVADKDCAFDQPCAFGHRVESHAVYCHNEAWPDSPRKCRRNRTDYKHEDCPGYVANPDVGTTA